MTARALHELLDRSALAHPNRTAVEEPDGPSIRYRDLAALTDRLRDRLWQLGVGPGDRVGIYLRKSIDAVASIFAILKAGAAYVPVDPGAPVARNAYALADCAVKALIIERHFEEALSAEASWTDAAPAFIVLDKGAAGIALDDLLAGTTQGSRGPGGAAESDLAYVLYTSGSTGKPKGVMLTHGAGLSFVDWASEIFSPRGDERFSAHAPFHFDLSILDIFLCIKHAATLVLITESMGKVPGQLASLIAERRITNWYSAPSILSLLNEFGDLDRRDFSALHTVLFAGEVFPIQQLAALKRKWGHQRFYNLYGPTETNVCTYFEIPARIPEGRTEPYPIGKACSHFRARVADLDGASVARGERGELYVSGRGTMSGYWNLPEASAQAFWQGGGERRWYKTGDIVIEADDGNFQFVGRRDRMVKRRGYRIELGEIESALYRHPAVHEAAVVAATDEQGEVRIHAFLRCREVGKRISVVELKGFCAQHLPLYMVPDRFAFQDALPKTSTDKIDYQALKRFA